MTRSPSGRSTSSSKEGCSASRNKLIQDAVTEKLQRLGRIRLAQEGAKLQIPAEQATAEEFFQGEAEWPEY